MDDSSDQNTPAQAGNRRLIDAAFQQVEAIPDDSRTTLAGLEGLAGRFRRQLPLDWLPGYEVESEIHRGGQGVVYKALQKSTRRNVAIKVLRDGALATDSELARFEQEVQVLGRLRHANIVSIFDSHTVDGRCCFVMDYIAGQTLDAYVRERDLSTRQVLGLFLKVCDAVNAAHLHGIIHRDLKPGNIRVDEAGEPYVLDFGLAKLTDQAEGSNMTHTGQFVGSMPWASPEQAAGQIDRIDLRTDVYAIGVLLYQMLTGRFPYAVDSSPSEVLQNVQHAEPIRLRRVRPDLPADIEIIVLKCLQKDAERRYQSAGDIGRDIARFLSGRPIEARADSLTYLLRKQFARHKLAAGVLLAFLAVLVGGFIATTTFWRQAVGQRDRALAAERATERSLAQLTVAHDAERAARVDAEREAEKARRIAAFIQGMLASVDPATAQGRDTSILSELLDDAAHRIDDELDGQPQVQAALHNTIGMTYYWLGTYEQAGPHLRDALDLVRAGAPPNQAALVDCLNNLGMLLTAQGEYIEAAGVYREALALQRDLPGDAPGELFANLNNLARLLHQQGLLDEAVTLFREALALPVAGTRSEARALALNNLALLLQDQRDYAAAEPLLIEALEIRREIGAALDPELAGALDNLGMLYIAMGRVDRAEEPLLEALRIRRKVLPDDHPKLAYSLNSMANFYHDRAEYDKAGEMYLDTLGVLRVQLGDEHPHIATTLNNLASLYQDQGDYAAAEPLFDESLAMRRKLLGPKHPQVAESMNNLALLLIDRGDFDRAERACRASLDLYRAIWGDAHARVALSESTLATLLSKTDRLEEAAEIYARTLATWRRSYGDVHPRVALALRNLASAKRQLGDLPEAEDLYREALALAGELYPGQHPSTAAVLYGLGQTLLASGQADEAETLVAEALEIRTALLPEGHWVRADTRGLLGAILTAQGRYEDAEPMLLEAEQQLASQRRASDDARNRAVTRLVELYEAWDKPEQSASWRVKLSN